MDNIQKEKLPIPLVSIILLVYNQSQFLKQAIEGLLMQRTSFSYEIIVHDDASSDGSREIIEEYVSSFPHIIKYFSQVENKYSVYGINFLYKFVVSKTKGKYIAMCSGDDYWIDPMKLQKQFNILESNSEIGLIHTKAAKFDQQKNEFNGMGGYKVDNLEKLLIENTIVALTVCLRKTLLIDYYKEVKPEERQHWPTEDFPTWAWFIQNSRIFFLDDFTAVYRSHLGSLSHIKDDLKRLHFCEGIYDIVDYYLSKNKNIIIEKKIRARYYSSMISMFFLNRKWGEIYKSIEIFYEANDWLNLLWIAMTLPFFYSKLIIKASYSVRSILFKIFNIYQNKI